MTKIKITGYARKSCEADEQCKLIAWADVSAACGVYPELALLHAIPNGGSRNKAEAAHLKRQGVRPGVPDLFLPVPKGKYHGLYIEMKFGKNKPTEAQKRWHRELVNQGYCVGVTYSALSAKKLIEAYMSSEVDT